MYHNKQAFQQQLSGQQNPLGYKAINIHMKPLDEEKLDVVHHFAGGVYAKEMTLKTMNDGMHQHKHHFDHMSILAEG
jgi:hypothetical protein